MDDQLLKSFVNYLKARILLLAVLPAECVPAVAGVAAEGVVTGGPVLAGAHQALVDVLLAGRPAEPGGRTVAAVVVHQVLAGPRVFAGQAGTLVNVGLAVAPLESIKTPTLIVLKYIVHQSNCIQVFISQKKRQPKKNVVFSFFFNSNVDFIKCKIFQLFFFNYKENGN